MTATRSQFFIVASFIALISIFGAIVSRSGEIHMMDQIEEKVINVIHSKSITEERDNLISLRNLLKSDSVGLSVIVQNPDGTKTDLATTASPNRVSSAQLHFLKGGDAWTSQSFVPKSIENLYVLYQE